MAWRRRLPRRELHGCVTGPGAPIGWLTPIAPSDGPTESLPRRS